MKSKGRARGNGLRRGGSPSLSVPVMLLLVLAVVAGSALKAGATPQGGTAPAEVPAQTSAVPGGPAPGPHAEALAPAQTDPAWPVFKHDAQRSGLSTVAGVMSNAELWSFTTSGYIDTTDYYPSPALSLDGGTIYYAAGGSLYALSASSGTMVWQYDLPSGTTFEASSPAVGPDGSVYVGATDGNLYAISPSGSLEWTFSTGPSQPGSSGQGIQSSPLVGPDGTVYFGSEDGYLYALSPPVSPATTPTLAWDYLTAQPEGTTCSASVPCGIFLSSPALSPSGSTVYIGGEDGNLYAISPPSTPGSTAGVLDWKTFLPRGYAGDPAYTPAVTPDGSTIYVTQYGSLYSVSSSGSVNWSSGTGTDYGSPSLGPDGTVYAGGCAFAPAGTEEWCQSGFPYSSPAVDTNGVLYAEGYNTGEPDPGLFAIFPAGGTGAWYFDSGAGSQWVGSPIIGANGTVYFAVVNAAGGGTLFAVGGPNSPRSVPSAVGAQIGLGGNSPNGLAVDPATGRVFASTCGSPSTVEVIDGSSNSGPTAGTVVASITAPARACLYGEAFDTTNGDLYVVDGGNSAVDVFAGTDYSLLATIPIGYGVSYYSDALAFDSANGDVYVATGSSAVAVIDGSSNTLVAAVPLAGSYPASDAVAYDAANQDVYVAMEYSSVQVINGSTNAVTEAIPISITAGGSTSSDLYLVGATYDPADGNVYFSDINHYALVGVSGATNTEILAVQLATPDRDYEGWAVAYDAMDGSFYVAGYDTSTVPVYNPVEGAVTETYPMGGWPIAILYDPVNGDIYVGNNVLSSALDAVEVIFASAPTVSSVSPSSGTPGQSVAIKGTDLGGATSVSFGTTSASGFVIVSPEEIMATAPSGAGTVDVTVTTPGGTSATSPADRFTFTLFTTAALTEGVGVAESYLAPATAPLTEGIGFADSYARPVTAALNDLAGLADTVGASLGITKELPVEIIFHDPPSYFLVQPPGMTGQVGCQADGTPQDDFSSSFATVSGCSTSTETVTIFNPPVGTYTITIFAIPLTLTVETQGPAGTKTASYSPSGTGPIYATMGGDGSITMSAAPASGVPEFSGQSFLVLVALLAAFLAFRNSRGRAAGRSRAGGDPLGEA